MKSVKNSIEKNKASAEERRLDRMAAAHHLVLRCIQESVLELQCFEEQYPNNGLDYPYNPWVMLERDEIAAILAARKRVLNMFFKFFKANEPVDLDIDVDTLQQEIFFHPYNSRRTLSIYKTEYLGLAGEVKSYVKQ